MERSVGSLAKIVDREIRVVKNPPTTVDFANEFDTAMRESNAFSWNGVLSWNGPQSDREIDVYLSERDTNNLSPEQTDLMADAVDIFDDLALSLEPNPSVSLYLVKETEMPVDQLIVSIQQLCVDQNRVLEFQEVL